MSTAQPGPGTAGAHPHFSRWAADRARGREPAAGFPTFEQVLDWLLDGLASTLPPR